jgi:pSer/pThr/pTyr-binding forkhead associated (FHA) protein
LLDGDSQGKPSTNGTSVNGQPCRSHDLIDGDLILFGNKVTAQYCVRHLGEDDFVRYLKLVTRRSLKQKVMDPNRTQSLPLA